MPHFNGGLFEDATALPLTDDQLELLIEAARADWRDVEPAIFGTLLERALDPVERHKLGAHYTPRAYVERLVLPTVIEPLRAEWDAVQSRRRHPRPQQGKRDGGRRRGAATSSAASAHVRVLDPACGSGNFLYVTLEHLKRLEGEVLDALRRAGRGAGRAGDGRRHRRPAPVPRPRGQPARRRHRRAGAVDRLPAVALPHPRHASPRPSRSCADFHNIECRDAVLAWDAVEPRARRRTASPSPAGTAAPTKTHPGHRRRRARRNRARPALSATSTRARPSGRRRISSSAIRRSSAQAACATRWATATSRPCARPIRDVPESADFVMYWWDKPPSSCAQGKLRRFGFITTNSLRQTFNRRVLEQHLQRRRAACPCVFAIPDHPWVDSADGRGGAHRDDGGRGGRGRRARCIRWSAERGGQGEGLDVDLERARGTHSCRPDHRRERGRGACRCGPTEDSAVLG